MRRNIFMGIISFILALTNLITATILEEQGEVYVIFSFGFFVLSFFYFFYSPEDTDEK